MDFCKSCADCGVINCHTMAGEFPDYCVSLNITPEQYVEAMSCYDDPETHKLAIAAGEVEYEGFGKLTRVEETIMFARKMGAKKLGMSKKQWPTMRRFNKRSQYFGKNFKNTRF